MDQDTYRKILSRLQAQCVKREYCIYDIRQKALKAVAAAAPSPDDTQTVQTLVDDLLKDRFVDESRYAAAFAREKSALTGWGPVKIRFALKAKGIDSATIDYALSEVDSDSSSKKLEKILLTRWKTAREKEWPKMDMLKFALTRGYDYEQATPIIEKIIAGELLPD